MPHIQRPLLSSSLLFALAFTLLSGSSAEAQQVLESGGVRYGGPSIIEIRSDTERLPVENITGRAEATGIAIGWRSAARVHSTALSTEQICQTPCRFQLDRPMELRLGDQELHLMPDGGPQSYFAEPSNTGGRIVGLLSIVTGSAFAGVGGLMLGLYHGLDLGDTEPNDELDPRAFRNVGRGFAIAGSVLLVAGIIVRIASRGRVERVDGFDF